MKKCIILLFFTFLISLNTHAELLTFGVKAGVSFPTQNYKFLGNKVDPSGITGFHAGVVSAVKVPLIGLGIQAEVLYSQKGSKYSINNRNFENRFHYIDIPIYIRWSLDLPLVSPYIGVGPYFSFPVCNKVKGNENFIELENKNFNNADFGIGFTLGVDIISRLQLSLAYQLGTKNIYDGAYDINVKNRNFTISLAYMIF